MQIISHSGCQNTDGWLRAEGKFNLTRHATSQKQGIGIHIAKKQGIGIHIAIPTSRTGTVSVTAWRTSAPPNPAPINLIRGRARNIQIDDGPPTPPLPTPPLLLLLRPSLSPSLLPTPRYGEICRVSFFSSPFNFSARGQFTERFPRTRRRRNWLSKGRRTNPDKVTGAEERRRRERSDGTERNGERKVLLEYRPIARGRYRFGTKF